MSYQKKITKNTGKPVGFSKLRSRGWCFTINNYDEKDLDLMKTLGSDVEKNAGVAYLVYGKEVGKQGTPHLQGYVRFVNARTGASMKKLHPTAHWEAQKGTNFDASVYCKKDGQYEEFGAAPTQGKSATLVEVAKLAAAGMSELEIIEKYPEIYVKYHNGLSKVSRLARMAKCARTEPPKVIWVYGTSLSKKEWCHNEAISSGYCCYFKANNKWWDGYQAGDCVIIDNIDPKYWKVNMMFGFLDRYEHLVEVRYGFIQFNSPCIYIICDKHPLELYDNLSNSYKHKLKRRITEIVKCNSDNTIERTKVTTDVYENMSMKEYYNDITLEDLTRIHKRSQMYFPNGCLWTEGMLKAYGIDPKKW